MSIFFAWRCTFELRISAFMHLSLSLSLLSLFLSSLSFSLVLSNIVKNCFLWQLITFFTIFDILFDRWLKDVGNVEFDVDVKICVMTFFINDWWASLLRNACENDLYRASLRMLGRIYLLSVSFAECLWEWPASCESENAWPNLLAQRLYCGMPVRMTFIVWVWECLNNFVNCQ